MAEETTGLKNSRKKYNIGKPPPPGNEFTGAFFKKLWEDAKTHKIDYLGLHKRWLQLHALFRGQRHRTTYPVVGANYIFKNIQAHCATLTEKQPVAEVQTDDNVPDQQKKAVEKEIETRWNEEELQSLLYASVQNMQIYGTTIEKGRFNLKENRSEVLLRDPFNCFPAPGFKLADIEVLPYFCDASFMYTWDIKTTFGLADDVHVKADAESTLFGEVRETQRGGKTIRSDPGRNLPANYSTITASGEKSESQQLKDKALVVEIWIKDESTTQEDVMGERGMFEEGPGGLQTEVFENGQPKMEEFVSGQREVLAYPDGIRKVTIAPGMISAENDGVLDDGPNPNINWNLLDGRIAELVTNGKPVAAVGPDGIPLQDPQTGQPTIAFQPVDQDEAQGIVYEVASVDFLWGRFPYSAVASLIDTTQWWGFSIIEQLEELQGKSENLLTKYFAYFDRCMFPLLINPAGSGVAASEISNEPGLQISPTVATASLFRYVELPPPPPGFLELLQFTLFQFDIVGGTPDVTEGRSPKGITAASAIIALQDKAATLYQPQIRSVDMIVRNRGRMTIHFLKNFGTEEKPVKVDEETFNLLGVDLFADFKYIVESGSSAPITKAGRRSQFIELFKLQAMDIESLLRMLEIPKVSEVIERVTQQSTLAGAIDILIQAGLPEETAQALFFTLAQSQGGTGRAQDRDPETNLERGGRSERTNSVIDERQTAGER